MPKKSWASPEQIQWLESQLSGFLKARENKTISTFFAATYTEFHERWPVASPTAEEIANAKQGEEQALSRKIKASESVS